MGWTRTSRAVLAADQQRVWAVLADLPRGPEWNPALAEVALDGRVETGQTG